jgi:hypothetical protein
MLLDLLTLAVLAWVGSRLVLTARAATGRRGRSRAVEVARGLRPRHFLLAVPILFAVLVAVVLLVQVPGLSFGWWTAIGGQGNPVVGSTDRTAGTALEWVIPAIFVTLLIPALPLLVEREERVFRAGSEERSLRQRLWWGFKFGMAHALVGIPIGAAAGLSIGGWYFTWAYLRGYRRGGRSEALLESSRSHLAYNLTVVVIVLLAIVVDALSG